MKKLIVIVLTLIMLMSVTLVVAGNPTDMKTNHKKVIIGFVDKPNQADENMIRGLGGKTKYTYHIINAKAVEIPEQAIDRIKKNPRVKYVEEDGEVHAHDIELDNSWGVERIGAGIVHDRDNTGAGVKVAIIDTGIDYTHTDLNDNYYGGYDFVNNDADPMDDAGHGSHCAGIVAAEDNGKGVVGVAPEAHLYGIKVLDSSGSGSWSNVIAGIEWSVDNDMQIISMSLGGGDYIGVEKACDAAYSADIVIVASAGNSGNPPGRGDNVGYPAKYSSVIAVAATDPDDKRARWSSTGPAVELATPGVNIYSTILNDDYGYKSGTSMAGPHVAGTAALVIASGITDGEYGLSNGKINDEVRMRLQVTADDLGDPGRDHLYGYGLVDADEAAPQTADVHDIAVTGIEAPSWVMKSDTVSVHVIVTNQGMYEESFTVTLSDTTDSVEIGLESVTLLAGESTTITFSWDTTGATIGDHDLKAEADVVVDETDTADNSMTTTVTVKEPSHDVAIIDVDAPSPVAKGDMIDVAVTVENQGTYLESFTVTLTDTTDSVEIGSESVTLASGESTTITFGWDTTGATIGDHDLKAEADVVVDETDTADNSMYTTVTVEEAPDNLMHVSAIDMWHEKVGRNYKIYTKVTIVDSSDSAVEEATVSLNMISPTGGTASGSGDTGPDGTVTFVSEPTRLTGTYKSEVTDVVKSGWTYDPSANVETNETLSVL